MIRFNYTRQIEPPAPFVHVSLRSPGAGDPVDDLPAQIDTGADRTVIPGGLVDRLGLEPLDHMEVAGLGGQTFEVAVYLVELTIRTLTSHKVVVIAHADKPYVLLGRDILNRYRLILDGPDLALEIG